MRGLAFSGGAAFGAYQVGAWLEISASDWRPDVVSGISIGGVNAYLVAHGATPAEMLEVWREWPAELLPNRVRRFAPPWAAQGPMFVAWIDRIVEEFSSRPLETRLRIVGLEALTLRQIVFEDAAVDRQALLAGCSLPGVLPPMRVNGRWCIDCGMLRYIPLRECLSLAADEIIAVDLLRKHPFPLARWAREWLLGGLDRIRGECSEPRPEELAQIHYTEIGHESVLGSIKDSFQWRREAADRMIELGRQDARACLGRHARNAAPMQSSHPEPVSAAPQ